ncbi:PhzF family phenazine biosynthesis protein [Streptomyces sp. NPDC012637]|uniref:PhzF family phenazine biosynthesis protein n=1 Tax=Streptomyces sp. NPDC012637 TaxID=3364842 RepID=UPI0036EBDD30
MDVVVVRACLRGGSGGSPTAVVVEHGQGHGYGSGPGTGAGALDDGRRRRVPADHGTSHAVFVRREPDGVVGLRFFTSAGELPACGHGTVAALALLASREGPGRVALRARGRVFAGRAERAAGAGGRFTAAFDPGRVKLREPRAEERGLVLAALGHAACEAGPDVLVAGVGRERMLVPVRSRAALAALVPDLGRLRAACDRLGLLGAYVHSAPSAEGALAARMFAPSIPRGHRQRQQHGLSRRASGAARCRLDRRRHGRPARESGHDHGGGPPGRDRGARRHRRAPVLTRPRTRCATGRRGPGPGSGRASGPGPDRVVGRSARRP